MATKKDAEITVIQVQQGSIDLLIKGTHPLICNAMSEKARQELLLPSGRKNAAQKASVLKHVPLQEFSDSMYRPRDVNAPTEIVVKATAFKSALMSAALDLPGTNKSQLGRLANVEGDEIAIYGLPQIFLEITRQKNIDRTPDVRTRAILPRWCCFITVSYTKPILKEQAILNLLSAAGFTQGIGDWRVQKGSGNYGQFELVAADDPVCADLIAHEGREAQREAIANPVGYNSETDTLLEWYDLEVKRRGFDVPKLVPVKG